MYGTQVLQVDEVSRAGPLVAIELARLAGWRAGGKQTKEAAKFRKTGERE
jgi:hypothetical protein